MLSSETQQAAKRIEGLSAEAAAVCVCVCVYVCVHVCVRACALCVCMCMRMCVYVYVCASVFVFVCTGMCAHASACLTPVRTAFIAQLDVATEQSDVISRQKRAQAGTIITSVQNLYSRCVSQMGGTKVVCVCVSVCVCDLFSWFSVR